MVTSVASQTVPSYLQHPSDTGLREDDDGGMVTAAQIAMLGGQWKPTADDGLVKAWIPVSHVFEHSLIPGVISSTTIIGAMGQVNARSGSAQKWAVRSWCHP